MQMNEFTDHIREDSSRLKPEQDTFIIDLTDLLGEQTELGKDPAVKEAAAVILHALVFEKSDEEMLRQAWIEYAKVVESAVESRERAQANPHLHAKMQIAAIIHKALLFRSAGHMLRYLEELDTAEVYAYHAGFDEISLVLAGEIRTQVDQLEATPEVIILKLKGIIDEDNRQFLIDQMNEGLDLDDLLGQVYGMLLDDSRDPDEVLVSLGITEREA